MTAPRALLIGFSLLAAAILVTNHWQIGAAPGAVVRLNRWTGAVVACNARDERLTNSMGGLFGGTPLLCAPD